MKNLIKIKLDISELNNSFGLISNSNDIKLAWTINESIGIELVRNKNINKNFESINVEFPSYSTIIIENEPIYILIKNRIDSYVLFETFYNVDYLLFIIGEILSESKNYFFSKIRQNESIRGIVPLNLNKLKEKEKEFLFSILDNFI